jgi:hypothetical protein
MSLRGILWGFGLKVGPTTRARFGSGFANSLPGIRAWRRSRVRFASRSRCTPWPAAIRGRGPTKYQSGQTDISGRTSKIGDASVRTFLYEAANIILTKPLKGCTALKSWAMKLARRSGMKKAKVALARKVCSLAVNATECDRSQSMTRVAEPNWWPRHSAAVQAPFREMRVQSPLDRSCSSLPGTKVHRQVPPTRSYVVAPACCQSPLQPQANPNTEF